MVRQLCSCCVMLVCWSCMRWCHITGQYNSVEINSCCTRTIWRWWRLSSTHRCIYLQPRTTARALSTVVSHSALSLSLFVTPVCSSPELATHSRAPSTVVSHSTLSLCLWHLHVWSRAQSTVVYVDVIISAPCAAVSFSLSSSSSSRLRCRRCRRHRHRHHRHFHNNCRPLPLPLGKTAYRPALRRCQFWPNAQPQDNWKIIKISLRFLWTSKEW